MVRLPTFDLGVREFHVHFLLYAFVDRQRTKSMMDNPGRNGQASEDVKKYIQVTIPFQKLQCRYGSLMLLETILTSCKPWRSQYERPPIASSRTYWRVQRCLSSSRPLKHVLQRFLARNCDVTSGHGMIHILQEQINMLRHIRYRNLEICLSGSAHSTRRYALRGRGREANLSMICSAYCSSAWKTETPSTHT